MSSLVPNDYTHFIRLLVFTYCAVFGISAFIHSFEKVVEQETESIEFIVKNL